MKKLLLGAGLFLSGNFAFCQSMNLVVDWSKKITISKSTPTLQVVGNPMLKRGSPIHEGTFSALSGLGADFVRYVPWFPYPKLAVAELEPPDSAKTSWDFSLIDPMTIDFFNATKGHSVILNFSTIPQWMFKTDKAVTYPANPDSVAWNYSGGSTLRDTTLKELSDYFARIVSWYHNGGFTDELGKYHKSGYHYAIPYWEVLNEPDLEHGTSVEDYTKRYDAIATAIHKVSPGTKFIGLAVSTAVDPHQFDYFLDPANHQNGVPPIDMISYHYYATGQPSEEFVDYQYSLFDKADAFLSCVRYIEYIRKKTAPDVKTDLDELGTFVNYKLWNKPIPDKYWMLSSSLYAYLFVELSKMGIDVIGESQLVGFPSQFPFVSMMDWTNGKPNARFWTLKLIKDNFAPGDTLVESSIYAAEGGDCTVQGFITKSGKKVLLCNKRDKIITLKLPAEFKNAKIATLDLDSGDNAPTQAAIVNDTIQVKPFQVSVITL
jgi:hypothetical protein